MKKWLLTLSAISIGVSALSSTLSITYNNNFNKANQRLIDLNVGVSSYALRSAVLYDVNSINQSFTTPYFYNKTIKSVFPDLKMQDEPMNGVDAHGRMDQLYKMIFGIGEYSFKWERDAEYKPGTPLSMNTSVAEDNANKDLKAPEQTTANTIQVITGGLTALLGSEINSNIISVILGMLSQDVVKDAIQGDGVSTIINQINDFLGFEEGDATDVVITKVLDALTEKNVSQDLTFEEMLKIDLNNLYKGLLTLIYQQTIKDDENVKYNEVFFDRVVGTEDEQLVATNQTDLIEAISYVIKFINSFCRYIAQFDQYRVANLKNLGPNHLFDAQKTNKEVLTEILTKKYKPGETISDDPTWFKVKDADGTLKYYSVINLKDFAANLYYYFAIDEENDPNGINLRKFFYIMMGDTSDSKVTNPVGEMLVNSGIGYLLSGLIEKLLGSLDMNSTVVKAIKAYIKSSADNFKALIGDVTRFFLVKIVNNEDLTQLLSLIKFVVGIAGLDEDTKKNVDQIIAYFDGVEGKKFIAHPFNELYKGNAIADLIKLIGPIIGEGFDYMKYSQIKNLKSIFTMGFGKLLNIFGVEELPEIIYALNNYSLNDFLISLARDYELIETEKVFDKEKKRNVDIVKEVKPFKEKYLDQFLNTQDFESIFTTLTAKNSGIFTSQGKQVGLISPLYNIILAGTGELNGDDEKQKEIIDELLGLTIKREGTAEPITILEPVAGKNNTYVVGKTVINYLLGLEPATFKFIPNTFLYALTRLYGSNYSQEEFDLNLHLIEDIKNNRNHKFRAMNKGFTTIFTKVIPIINDVVQDSLNSIIEDKYMKYLKDDNFEIKNLDVDGFNLKKAQGQKIEYDLVYHDPDTNKDFIYHVYFTKGYYGDFDPDWVGGAGNVVRRGFILRKMIRQD